MTGIVCLGSRKHSLRRRNTPVVRLVIALYDVLASNHLVFFYDTCHMPAYLRGMHVVSGHEQMHFGII